MCLLQKMIKYKVKYLEICEKLFYYMTGKFFWFLIEIYLDKINIENKIKINPIF